MFKLSKSNNINLAKIHDKADDLLDAVPFIKRRRRRRKVFKIFKYIGIIFGIFIILSVIIFGTTIIGLASVSKNVVSGKNNLENTLNLIKNQEFKVAITIALKAENNFKIASDQLIKIQGNFFVANTFFINKQVDDIAYLVKTAEILSRAVYQGTVIGAKLEEITQGRTNKSFSKFTVKEKRELLRLIYESSPELNGIKANLDLAVINMERVRSFGVLWFAKDKIEEIKTKLILANNLITKAVPASEILPILGGYPNASNYLVIIQNNDELRPTGGFIGTFSTLKTENGDIVNFDTHDIYHLDMPVKDKINITPPLPLKKYLGVDKWYMRDANWSPDWPTSAEKIEWFYHKENFLLPANEEAKSNIKKFDGVIAITPEFVIELIEITGPIIIDGEEYNKDNFMDLLQYKVERGYIQLGISKWQRKEVIGSIMKQLKIDLLNLPSSRWKEIINIIESNLLSKEVLVYLHDEQLQNYIRELGWSGEIVDANSDYLMVVDANMASFKTDAVVSRSIKYELEESKNKVLSKLRINYSHFGNFDYKTTRYRTYTRVYVPLGAKLVKFSGLSEGEVDIGTEYGKTYFGAFVSIEPGEMGYLYLEYELPNRIKNDLENGEYEFYIQKQPGNSIKELIVDLSIENEIKSYKPTGFYVSTPEKGKVIWNTSLNADRSFKINNQ